MINCSIHNELMNELRGNTYFCPSCIAKRVGRKLTNEEEHAYRKFLLSFLPPDDPLVLKANGRVRYEY